MQSEHFYEDYIVECENKLCGWSGMKSECTEFHSSIEDTTQHVCPMCGHPAEPPNEMV